MISLKHLIFENAQLAAKLYGSKLEKSDIDLLDMVTHHKKDHTYKTLAELRLEDKFSFNHWTMKQWQDAYSQLSNYNSNVFPIEGFSFDSSTPTINRKILMDRAAVLKAISKWPNFALRNLRKDIRHPRQSFDRIRDRIEYIDAHLDFLNNKPEDQKIAILKKVFSSEHPTFEDVLDYVEEKENLLASNFKLSRPDLYKLVKLHDYDLKIVYDDGKKAVIDVTGQPGMKALGCNSLWCFSYGDEYGKGGEHFDHYSFNGHVYAIINFSISPNDKDFMHVVTKPFDNGSEDNPGIYNMANEEEYGDAHSIASYLAGPDAMKVFTWGDVLNENEDEDEFKVDKDRLFYNDNYLDEIAESLGYPDDYTKIFWNQSYIPTLYHCTTQENYEKIRIEGLNPKNKARGISNRHIHAAVFTTAEEAEVSFFKSYYGPIVIAINASQMKKDGFMPTVEQEPDWARAFKLEFVLRKLGVPDDKAESSRFVDSSDQNTQGTVIVYSKIPVRYLSLSEHD